jgi:hypothetical protein
VQSSLIDESGYLYIAAGLSTDYSVYVSSEQHAPWPVTAPCLGTQRCLPFSPIALFAALSQLNDVWKSSVSFHDLQAVSSACKVEIPACGVGLKCWPGASTVRATDGSFVSCAACVHPSLASSQSASGSVGIGVVIALAVFVLVAVLLLLCCVWIVYAVVRAGHPSPVPLPAALQSRWAPKGQNFTQLLSTE